MRTLNFRRADLTGPKGRSQFHLAKGGLRFLPLQPQPAGQGFRVDVPLPAEVGMRLLDSRAPMLARFLQQTDYVPRDVSEDGTWKVNAMWSMPRLGIFLALPGLWAQVTCRS